MHKSRSRPPLNCHHSGACCRPSSLSPVPSWLTWTAPYHQYGAMLYPPAKKAIGPAMEATAAPHAVQLCGAAPHAAAPRAC